MLEDGQVAMEFLCETNKNWNGCYRSVRYRFFSFQSAKIIIIPHQKLLQPDWLFTHQHFRCLVLSPFESCHMINIILPRKLNICHVRDIMLLCKPNIYHASIRKVILRRVVCSDTYST